MSTFVVDQAIRAKAAELENRPVSCRVCGCTETDGCPAGCAWAPGCGDLCTVCAEAVMEIGEVALIWAAAARTPNFDNLVREVRNAVDQAVAAEAEGAIALEPQPRLYGAGGEVLL